jgi:hypothetical protein
MSRLDAGDMRSTERHPGAACTSRSLADRTGDHGHRRAAELLVDPTASDTPLRERVDSPERRASCGSGLGGVRSLHTPRRDLRPGRDRVPGPSAGTRRSRAPSSADAPAWCPTERLTGRHIADAEVHVGGPQRVVTRGAPHGPPQFMTPGAGQPGLITHGPGFYQASWTNRPNGRPARSEIRRTGPIQCLTIQTQG